MLIFALWNVLYACTELSSFSLEKVTVSPRKMMLAMSNYIPNFNLTSQQVELCVCLRIDLVVVLCFSFVSCSCLVFVFVGCN